MQPGNCLCINILTDSTEIAQHVEKSDVVNHKLKVCMSKIPHTNLSRIDESFSQTESIIKLQAAACAASSLSCCILLPYLRDSYADFSWRDFLLQLTEEHS